MNEKNGILYGVGVGPGDPELMTLKAVKCIKQADVIFCPQQDSRAFHIAEQAVPEINDKPDSVQVESPEVETPQLQTQPASVSRRTNPSSSSKLDTALSKAEATLYQAWENSFNQVCKEMDQAGFREFLPIHVDYGTYEIDPVMRQVTSGLSVDELQIITSLNEALDRDYSQRLYARYGSLPSLYDKSTNLPEDELKYYRNLAANFKKFTPYSKKDIK